MKKKFVGVFALSILLIFSGCNSSKELKTADPISVTLWHYYSGENQKTLDNLVSDFNKTVGLEKGIIVNTVAKGSSTDIEKAITDSADGLIDSEEMPDIFSAYPDKALEIYQKGLLCDLDKYFTQDEKNEYVENFINDGIFENNAFVLMPIAKSTEVLYINDNVYEEFIKNENIPKDAFDTFEGIYKAAKKFYDYTDKKTKEKGDGKSMIGFDSTASFFIMGCKQLGVNVADFESQKAILSKKVLKKVFENFYKGFVMGYYGNEAKYRTDDLKSEFIISYIGSSSGASYFPTWIERDGQQKKIKLKVMDYPKFKDGKSLTVRQGAGMCIAKSDEKREEAAATFLKWFTKKEQNIKFIKISGYLPVKKDAYESYLFNTGDKKTDEDWKDEALTENLKMVYALSKKQILENKTYSVQPFNGSYSIRKSFDYTVPMAIKEGKKIVDKLRKSKIFDEDKIMKKLDFDARFEEWFENLVNNLKKQNIDYKILS